MRSVRAYVTISFALVLSLTALIISTTPVFAAGTIAITPASGSVGSTLGISGTGFTTGSVYTVTYDGVAIPGATGTIAAGGNLVATTFVTPTSTAGSHTVQVTTTAGATDTSNIRTYTITPKISLSSTTVQAGNSVIVQGVGYGASRTVTIYIDDVSGTTANSNSLGTVNATISIPSGAGGTHTVRATDTALNTAITTYTVTPSVTINSTSVAVGSQLTVNGSSFSASSVIRMSVDGVSISTATTNAAGSFNVSVSVPQGAAGAHNLTATDSSSNSAVVRYNITPSISVTPGTITTASQVTVVGNGFAASSGLNFYMDGSIVAGSNVASNSLGHFNASGVIIPPISGGNHVFLAKDGSNNSATFKFSLTQAVTVSPESGPSGATVQVVGKGFSAGKTISIKLDSAAVATNPSPLVVNAAGDFTTTFTIPVITGGAHSVDVSDGTFILSSTLNVTYRANLSVVRGNVGAVVTVTGTSFASSAAILVTYDGDSIADGNADKNGVFSITFNIPSSSGGNHSVIVTDHTRSMVFNYFVTAKVVINPTSGFVGTSISLIGSGFTANKTITIDYDIVKIREGNALKSDGSGGFAIVFNVPASVGGNRSIVVSDGTSTIVSTFTMDSTAPPIPSLLMPANGARVGAIPEFQWQEVTDLSGVTYLLQISRDPNFSTLVLQKTELTTPGYQITGAEKLESVSKKEPYYWRVRAIDGALNESAFVVSQTFSVGFIMPGWALYTIFGACVVIAFLFGLLLRRRKSAHTTVKPEEP